MRFIKKFKNKFSYNFIVGVITAHLLCGGSYSAVSTDDELIERTRAQYTSFRGITITGAKEPVHPLLQFAWSLSESGDQDAQRKVVLIISGQVWGIDSNRSANDVERGVYYSLIGRARAGSATRETFRPTVTDTTTPLVRHTSTGLGYSL
jgi:hypothetical protein